MENAKKVDERLWELPLFEEYRKELKGKNADYRNIGTTGNAGAQIAACFLELFLKNDVEWAHLDIAGVADSMNHLSYCSSSQASGYMIRTLTNLLVHGKL